MAVHLLHQTDLFRPHQDPDDHWDLACVYALAFARQLTLHGVLIDYPPPDRDRTPDIAAIAQLNYLTGLRVPFGAGSPKAMSVRTDQQKGASRSEENGIRMVLDTLQNAPEPVVITIVGSCRDVAIAGNRAPDLFREKCAGIYLNAGSGTPIPERLGELEYNVRLNVSAFAAIFDLPCPVYWMPCFEITPPNWCVEEYGTFYRFRQDEILPYLSPRLQNYFISMFGHKSATRWLGDLCGAKDEAIFAAQLQEKRNMYCTAGFLHAVGKMVTRAGDIVDVAVAGETAVFTFDEIEVRCKDNGETRWKPGISASKRFIFHVRDVEAYPQAMTKAMKSLLRELP